MIEIPEQHPVAVIIPLTVRIRETMDLKAVFSTGIELRQDFLGNIFCLAMFMDERNGSAVMQRMNSDRMSGCLKFFHDFRFFRRNFPGDKKSNMSTIFFEQRISLQPIFTVIVIESETNGSARLGSATGQPAYTAKCHDQQCSCSHFLPASFFQTIFSPHIGTYAVLPTERTLSASV